LRTDIAGRLEVFVKEQFNISPTDQTFSRDADLLDGGYIDSVGVVELLEFVSTEFGVEVPETDLLSDDFTNIEGIARIVARARASVDGHSC
jgi:acyl carrier protein